MSFEKTSEYALCTAFGVAVGVALGQFFGPAPQPLPDHVTLVHDNGDQEAFFQLKKGESYGGMSGLIRVGEGENTTHYGSFGYTPLPK